MTTSLHRIDGGDGGTRSARVESEVRVRAPVHEVFVSIQGEGHYLGEPQVFLRLAGCPLRCRWCDTPAALEVPSLDERTARPGGARIHRPSGATTEEPWATPFRAAVWIGEVEDGTPRTLSVTGGEPLLWPAFLTALPAFLGTRRLHLETSGVPVEALERVVDAFDHVSLDLKPPFDLAPPVADGLPDDEERWAEARRVALALVRGRDACAKLVVSGGRDPRAYFALLDDLFELAPELPLYLQPVTPLAGFRAPERRELDDLVTAALERELTVRVVPQVHRLLRLP